MKSASESRVGEYYPYHPSVSRRAARAEESTSPTTSDSRSYTDYSQDPARTPPRIRNPPPLRLGSPLLADTLPERVSLECQKALPQALALPSVGWPTPLAEESGPFAPPALPGFIATTNPVRPCASHRYSAPRGSSTWSSPLASRRRFPRSTQEPLAGLTPSSCRSPLGQSAGFLRAPSQANDWSLVSATSIRFRHVINGSLAFVLPAHT
jgi:hypothetical protein